MVRFRGSADSLLAGSNAPGFVARAALIAAPQERCVAAAALDVTREEPLLATSRLWRPP